MYAKTMDERPFQIDDFVKDKCTGFSGEIVGIAIYKYEPRQIYVRRTTPDVNGLYEVKWFSESSLESSK